MKMAAGRKNKQSADYFPHYVQHGDKMKYIVSKYGNDGYATWFRLMEKLAKENMHYVDLSKPMALEFLASNCMIDEKKLIDIIELLIQFEWLDEGLWIENKVLFSQEFVNSLMSLYDRRKSQLPTVSMIYEYINAIDVFINRNDVNIKRQSKVKESKVKNSIVVDSAKNLDFREEKFKEDVFSHDYPQYLLQAFFSYWSEPTKSKKKMRWEMQKTWDTKRRLTTWASRDDKYTESVKATKRADSKIIRYD